MRGRDVAIQRDPHRARRGGGAGWGEGRGGRHHRAGPALGGTKGNCGCIAARAARAKGGDVVLCALARNEGQVVAARAALAREEGGVVSRAAAENEAGEDGSDVATREAASVVD